MLRISVVICTRNRADYLRKALLSLVHQTINSSSDYEVIVVDNASNDNTVLVVEQFRSTLPHLYYVYEPRIGLSWARNTGAQAAQSPYVAYLDDDAQAQCDWLEQLLRTFEEICPQPVAVGGRVLLEWGGNVPTWLSRRYWSLYTYLDLGEHEHILTADEHLVGANIAFRRDALLEVGAFNTKLGRKGSMLLSGEEADLIRRLSALQLPIYYVPQAAVLHAVSPERLQKKWLRQRLFWDGASQPLLDYPIQQTSWFYMMQTYRDMRRIAFFIWQWLRAQVQGNATLADESAGAMIQRIGRLRTNLLLIWSDSV